MHPVYEALTVAINQLVQRDRTQNYGWRHSFVTHPPLPGREPAIAVQLALGSDDEVAQRAWTTEIERAVRRREARMRRRASNR